MYNRQHLGGLNLKTKALNVGQRVKLNVIMSKSNSTH